VTSTRRTSLKDDKYDGDDDTEDEGEDEDKMIVVRSMMMAGVAVQGGDPRLGPQVRRPLLQGQDRRPTGG
jgi:hypothetical protein